MHSSTAALIYTQPAADDISTSAPNGPAVPRAWSLVVQLADGCGTTTLLKIVSTLHVRHAEVSHLEFRTQPDGAGVLTLECSTVVADIGTVRKSIERIVDVLGVTAHEILSQNGHFPHDTPAGVSPAK